MRIAVVINSAAGGLIGRAETEAALAARLRESGLEPVLVPESAGKLPARLDAALALHPDALVVGGGDGTIAAAAARLADTGVPLGILPLGTMNLLARDLGLPEDLDAAARALAGAERLAIDVAEVNGAVFLVAAMIGLPTRLGRHRERARGRGGLSARIGLGLAALRGALRHPPMRLALALPGRAGVRVWTRALVVTCNPLDAERFPARRALDAGSLGVYVARDFGAWWVVRFALRLLLGRPWGEHPDLAATEAPRLTVLSPRRTLRVMLDGEAALLRPPLRFRIRRGALTVLAPPRTAALAAAAALAEAVAAG
jgi:diacylglycerol kinase family enzyme